MYIRKAALIDTTVREVSSIVANREILKLPVNWVISSSGKLYVTSRTQRRTLLCEMQYIILLNLKEVLSSFD